MNFLNRSQNSKLQNSIKFIEGQGTTSSELRTILSTDTFPCFSCFDQPALRINCDVCDKLGFVRGDHPMVQFVDDFLTKNLPDYMEITRADQKYDGSSKPEKQNLGLARKQCRSTMSSYSAREQSNQLFSSNLVKSSNVPTTQETHYDFCCNYCSVDPILGKRFHCDDCEDFDLCEKCYMVGAQIDDHKKSHKMTIKSAEINKPKQFIEQLNKSGFGR